MRIKNWDKFQHYKNLDRLVWIKFYVDILDDYEINQLPEQTQLLLFKLWLVAGKTQNKIPDSIDKLKFMTKMNVTVEQLQTLEHHKFIVFHAEDIEEVYKESITEERREEEKREDIKCDRAQLQEDFEEAWIKYPSKTGKTRAGKSYIKARLLGTTKETILDGIDRYIKYVAKQRIKFPDLHYKNGQTFFGQECWNDEMVIDTPKIGASLSKYVDATKEWSK